MALEIRDLTASDEPQWRTLWADYLEFYRQTLGPEVSDATWSRLMDPSNAYWGLAAVEDGSMFGFAHNQTMQSTWSVDDVVYLEDLYVDPEARRKGIGRALIEASAARTKEMGWVAYFWQTEADNQTARKLYDSMTGGPTNWVKYALPL